MKEANEFLSFPSIRKEKSIPDLRPEEHCEVATTADFVLQDQGREIHDQQQVVLPLSTGLPDTISLLLAEDHTLNLNVILLQLKKLGYDQVDIALNGQEAVTARFQKDYQLILMDNQMPLMNGLEATRIIRERERAERCIPVPIIAMTAFAMEGDREKCLDAGMSDYIAKPVTLDVLNRMLIKWVPSRYNRGLLNMETVNALLELGSEGDISVINALLELFRQETPVKIKYLRSLLAEGKYQIAAGIAHNLKSGSLSLGMAYLASQFEEIEKFAALAEGVTGGHVAEQQLMQTFEDSCAALEALVH